MIAIICGSLSEILGGFITRGLGRWRSAGQVRLQPKTRVQRAKPKALSRQKPMVPYQPQKP